MMQTIERILMMDGSVGTWTDAYGKELSAPELVIGIRAKLRLDLRQTAVDETGGMLLPVDPANATCDSYYIALDSDYLQETDPKLLKTSGITLLQEDTEVEVMNDDGAPETITVTRIILEVEIPNTAVPGLLDAVAANKSVSLNGEIGGYAAGATASTADFACQFGISIRNRVWLGGDIPDEVENDPEYWNAAQIQAFIANYFKPEKGDKGDPGKSAYEVAKAGGYTGTEAEWLASLNGKDGESAYEIAVAGGYTGTEAEWLASLKGETGKNAYEVAVDNGYAGTPEEWLISLKGERGDDLHFDATGELSERGAYDGERAGFTFGAALPFPDEQKTELYIYVKKSDEWNDWCSPLVITVYARNGKDGENVALIEPLDFVRPEGSETYLYFNMKDFPAATIAAVCIDMEEGEYRLPYDSARGIQKIIKYADGTVRIYFGTLVPSYQTGRVYFAQGSSGLTQYQLYLADGGTLTFDEWRESAIGGSVKSVNGETGAVILDKGDLGLGNVENTSDADKPVSTATLAALNDKAGTGIATPSANGLMSSADKVKLDNMSSSGSGMTDEERARLLPSDATDGDLAICRGPGGNDVNTRFMLQPGVSGDVSNIASGGPTAEIVCETPTVVDDYIVSDGNTETTVYIKANTLAGDVFTTDTPWCLDVIMRLVSAPEETVVFGYSGSEGGLFVRYISYGLTIYSGNYNSKTIPYTLGDIVRVTLEYDYDTPNSRWVTNVYKDGVFQAAIAGAQPYGYRENPFAIGMSGMSPSYDMRVYGVRLVNHAPYKGVSFTPDALPWRSTPKAWESVSLSDLIPSAPLLLSYPGTATGAQLLVEASKSPDFSDATTIIDTEISYANAMVFNVATGVWDAFTSAGVSTGDVVRVTHALSEPHYLRYKWTAIAGVAYRVLQAGWHGGELLGVYRSRGGTEMEFLQANPPVIPTPSNPEESGILASWGEGGIMLGRIWYRGGQEPAVEQAAMYTASGTDPVTATWTDYGGGVPLPVVIAVGGASADYDSGWIGGYYPAVTV